MLQLKNSHAATEIPAANKLQNKTKQKNTHKKNLLSKAGKPGDSAEFEFKLWIFRFLNLSFPYLSVQFQSLSLLV